MVRALFSPCRGLESGVPHILSMEQASIATQMAILDGLSLAKSCVSTRPICGGHEWQESLASVCVCVCMRAHVYTQL